ncbi:hypothetical protein Ancab_022610 [Ancistrocladus abbreviatus]
MAESTPLLDQSEEVDGIVPAYDTRNGAALDKAIEQCLGDQFGWIQLLQVLFVSLSWAFDAQQVFISIFTDAAPKWHCTHGGDMSSCSPTRNICNMPRDSWAWDLPAHVSIISEWNLQCFSLIISSLPATSFFIGCLMGVTTLSFLADSSLGRKNMLVISCLVMSSGGVLAALSTNIWMYSAFRFVSGFGRASVTNSGLVLSTEIVGKLWRGHVGLIAYSIFTAGFLSLPAMAYMCRTYSWRILYLLTSVPAVIYTLLAHFCVLESPRWLFLHGRQKEAIEIFGRFLQADLQSTERMTSIFYHVCIEEETPKNDMYSAMKILMSKRWAVQRLLAVMIVAFGIAMIYFGMPLGVGNLGFNLYLSVTLNALFELPAAVIVFFLLNHVYRRSAIVVLTFLSGICSLMCAIIPSDFEGLKIMLELTSYFSACTTFDLLLIYAVELFPTCVRNSAMSMVKQAIILGSAISPVLVAAGQENWFLQYGVFGFGIWFCGLFVTCLPETRGESMCDTMEEQEYKEKAHHQCLHPP